MAFEAFQKLYLGDPITLHCALEILLQRGRCFVLDCSENDLVDELELCLKNLFSEAKLFDMAEAAKMLAHLETDTLLDYIKRVALIAEGIAEKAN